jgi:hypothetical protein
MQRAGIVFITFYFLQNLQVGHNGLEQGIPKEEVSLYWWPPVWLFLSQLYDNWQFLFLFIKQANPNQSNRSTIQWHYSVAIVLLHYTRLERLASDRHSSLLGPFTGYEESEMLWKWDLKREALAPGRLPCRQLATDKWAKPTNLNHDLKVVAWSGHVWQHRVSCRNILQSCDKLWMT